MIRAHNGNDNNKEGKTIKKINEKMKYFYAKSFSSRFYDISYTVAHFQLIFFPYSYQYQQTKMQ